MKALPPKYVERMKSLLGEEYPLYERTFSEPSARGLQINTHKISPSDFDALFSLPTEPLSYAEGGRRLLSDVKVGADPMHAAGLYYMQDPGAMSAVAALPSVGGRVLDVAAAPGGKTIAAALRAPSAFVVANEVNFSRAKILMQNVERLGLRNVAVTSLSPSDLGKYAEGMFDLVIADLPCSGEGMFRKEDAAVEAWNENITAMNASRQREILEGVLPALREGGTLLYSTCTYSLEEDEEIVRYLIEEKGMTLLEPREAVRSVTANGISVGGLDLTRARRFYPFLAAGEGQFFAILGKGGEPRPHTARAVPPKISVGESKRIRAFTDRYLTGDLGVITRQGDAYYAVSPLARTLPLRYLSEGVRIGEFAGDKFIPHHNLFTAFGDFFRNREDLPFADPRLAAYLHGEEIEAKQASDGYVCVTVEGYPLGGGNAVGGRIKNRYPKGLRI